MEFRSVLFRSKLNIPNGGIVDTNCDPDEIDYIIPANDDEIRAVKLLTSKMADAIIEGKQGEESAEGLQPEVFLEEAEEAEENTETKEVTEKTKDNKIHNIIYNE